jgi:beta-alanine--pyruvate transaminase
MELFRRLANRGPLVRATGDIIALLPPLIVEEVQLDTMVAAIAAQLAHIE